MQITPAQIKELKKRGFINGCGGKCGFDFSEFIAKTIALLPNYLAKKGLKLFKRIEEEGCYPHDLRYALGNNIFLKIKADLILVYTIFKLLNWTTFFKRLGVVLVIFWGLLKHGNQYFNFGEKVKLEELLASDEVVEECDTTSL